MAEARQRQNLADVLRRRTSMPKPLQQLQPRLRTRICRWKSAPRSAGRPTPRCARSSPRWSRTSHGRRPAQRAR
jgi:hypothetical protein